MRERERKRVTSGRPKEEGVEKREKGAMNCAH